MTEKEEISKLKKKFKAEQKNAKTTLECIAVTRKVNDAIIKYKNYSVNWNTVYK